MIRPTSVPALVLIIICSVYFSSIPASAQLTQGTEVIEAMHREYQSVWYRNLTFKQRTTFYGPDGKVQRIQTWHEAMEIPGKLAIKFDEKNSGNGILFRNQKQYGYANGELIQEMKRVHDLLVLGFDVYRQHPDSTVAQLSGAGYNIADVYEDEWQGRPVYVVGTSEPDSSKAQFWIDKERLVFVRSLKPGRAGTLQEVQFNKYEQLEGGWIAPEVIFNANGQTGLLEEYSEIAVPDSINQAVFDPRTFVDAEWE